MRRPPGELGDRRRPGSDRHPVAGNTSSVIASKSIASVFTRRRPCTRRCSATRAGLSSNTCQPTGHTEAASSGR